MKLPVGVQKSLTDFFWHLLRGHGGDAVLGAILYGLFIIPAFEFQHIQYMMTMPSRTTRTLLSRVILPLVTRQPATVPTLEILYT